MFCDFYLTVGSNLKVYWVCSTTLCDWSGKLAPPFQQIKCKTRDTRKFVTRVFPRFRQFDYVVEFLLVPFAIFFALIGYCDYCSSGFTTLPRALFRFT